MSSLLTTSVLSVQRYDVLSTGIGALVVTSYFWAKGQDPWTALSITLSATAFALVLNELLPQDNKHR